jgi:ABC-2 type transport system ATP-binding protein
MSVVRPTEAQGTVMNHAVGSKASLTRVGYLPEHHRFPRYLTGRQTLEFFAALSEVDRPTRKKRSAELLETVGMTRWADARIGTYSKGMMQRVGVAAALVNDPQLVILDEPTDGVDPVGRREIRDVLLRLRGEGRTVFVNSHLLSELEMMADRVAILVAGRVVKQGTMDEMTVTRQCFEIEVASNEGNSAALKKCVEERMGGQWNPRPAPPGMPQVIQGKLPSGIWIELQEATLRLGTAEASEVQPVIDALRKEGWILRRLQSVRPSLEDLFIEAVGGVAGGHQAGASFGIPPAGRGQGGRP